MCPILLYWQTSQLRLSPCDDALSCDADALQASLVRLILFRREGTFSHFSKVPLLLSRLVRGIVRIGTRRVRGWLRRVSRGGAGAWRLRTDGRRGGARSNGQSPECRMLGSSGVLNVQAGS